MVLLVVFLNIGCSKTEVTNPGEEFDAGVIFATTQKKLIHKFAVLNSTTEVVRVIGESHSCGCTSIDLTPATLAPGERTSLTMELSVPRGHDKRRVSCFVATDHPKFPRWAYHLSYESFPQAEIVPSQIRLGQDFDGSGRSAKADVFLKVYSPPGSEHPPAPVNQVAPQGIRADMDPSPVDQVATKLIRTTRYRVKTELLDRAQSDGSFAQPLSIYLDNGFVASTLIVWAIAGPVTVTPSSIHFGMVSATAQSATKTILVRSKDGIPFKILSAEADSRLVQVEVDDLAHLQNMHSIKLSFQPSVASTQWAISGSIRVRTDRQRSDELNVPWSAFVRRPGEPAGDESVSHPKGEMHCDTSQPLPCS